MNDENLCDLYKALGPDALCDTCRLYPRHTEEYEGLRELSLSLSCPEAARIILSCQEPVRFLAEETDEEDDFEEFDFMMFSQLEDTRDVLFKILQNRTMPLQERMRAAEQLAEQYQICMEEQREYDIDDLLRKYEKHLEEGTLSECAAESLAQKGVDAAGFHVWERQRKELAVLRSLERLRPEWDEVLDGTEKCCTRMANLLTRPSVKNSTAPLERKAAVVPSGKHRRAASDVLRLYLFLRCRLR